ncbi:putative type I restriction enzymeP M protein [Flavobacterium anhuiense]|uniref:site-specific DNA-methyltransferase (adenine-specific) n=1 Tax=Flavobacterium anhuiense TaxID=459526 RepID=A0AAC9CZA8_9FLAO|nr:type I restriction-modification system subunit M [Flavobacterium anhuiense]AOC94579.1 putative type I restriction enzymeP M protein [Flavobacterium anhuiense]
MLHNNPALKSLINSLWTVLWGGGIANPLSAIEQITYLLFMKRLDEIEKQRESEATKEGKKYLSKFSGTYTPEFILNETESEKKSKKKIQRPKTELRWSNFSKLESNEDLLKHTRYNVFQFIKTLNSEDSTFTKYMSNAVFIIEKPSLLADAVNKIDEIFVEIEKDAKEGGHNFQDIQGDVYEMLLSEIAQAGKNGQFRTPRHIIKLMAELVKPKLGDKIADPACGTSGFLLGAFQYILTDLAKKDKDVKIEKDEDGFEIGAFSSLLNTKTKSIIDKSFYGFDIDITMVRLGLMNLIMHGIDNPKIDYKDSLSKSYSELNCYDIILANPPFTGKLDKDDLNPNLRVDTSSSELLFLDRISSMLKTGGKAAVIIPEGVLFSSLNAQKKTREIILKDNNLEAVISLPSGTFKPYTGVKTAILVFTKIEQDSKEWNTQNVWFYELNSDGYSLDDNRRRLKDFPLPETVNNFEKRNKIKMKDRKSHFYVPISEIQENDLDLSYNRYKEYVYVEQTYDPPKEILAKLILLEDDILKELKELNNLIG